MRKSVDIQVEPYNHDDPNIDEYQRHSTINKRLNRPKLSFDSYSNINQKFAT